MAVLKNRSTERNREFWEYVERLAHEVRTNPHAFTGVQEDSTKSCKAAHEHDNGAPNQERNENHV
jgi:hypothetical protein